MKSLWDIPTSLNFAARHTQAERDGRDALARRQRALNAVEFRNSTGPIDEPPSLKRKQLDALEAKLSNRIIAALAKLEETSADMPLAAFLVDARLNAVEFCETLWSPTGPAVMLFMAEPFPPAAHSRVIANIMDEAFSFSLNPDKPRKDRRNLWIVEGVKDPSKVTVAVCDRGVSRLIKSLYARHFEEASQLVEGAPDLLDALDAEYQPLPMEGTTILLGDGVTHDLAECRIISSEHQQQYADPFARAIFDTVRAHGWNAYGVEASEPFGLDRTRQYLRDALEMLHADQGRRMLVVIMADGYDLAALRSLDDIPIDHSLEWVEVCSLIEQLARDGATIIHSNMSGLAGVDWLGPIEGQAIYVQASPEGGRDWTLRLPSADPRDREYQFSVDLKCR